jgi:hypothetical protein
VLAEEAFFDLLSDFAFFFEAPPASDGFESVPLDSVPFESAPFESDAFASEPELLADFFWYPSEYQPPPLS